jgi:hypothetical protein
VGYASVLSYLRDAQTPLLIWWKRETRCPTETKSRNGCHVLRESAAFKFADPSIGGRIPVSDGTHCRIKSGDLVLDPTMTEESDVSPAELLCRRCGVCCCRAVLSGVRLEASEIAFATKHELRVLMTMRGPAFALPCPLLEQRCCNAYAERPRSCRNFRCRTLRSLEDGSLSLTQALDRMTDLQQRILTIESALQADDRNALWWAAGLLGDPDTTDQQRVELSEMLGVVLPQLLELRRITNEWVASPDDLTQWSKQ